MKCFLCGAENNDGAKFCRNCGSKLEIEYPMNIMDKYPEFNFQPTTLIDAEVFGSTRFRNFIAKQLGYERMCSIADYIQVQSFLKNPTVFRFFIKDNKFGLLKKRDNKYIIHLKAEYDFLAWKKRPKLLYAKKDGRNFVIDVLGNELK